MPSALQDLTDQELRDKIERCRNTYNRIMIAQSFTTPEERAHASRCEWLLIDCELELRRRGFNRVGKALSQISVLQGIGVAA